MISAAWAALALMGLSAVVDLVSQTNDHNNTAIARTLGLGLGLGLGLLVRLVVPARSPIGVVRTTLVGFGGALSGALVGATAGVKTLATLPIQLAIGCVLLLLVRFVRGLDLRM